MHPLTLPAHSLSRQTQAGVTDKTLHSSAPPCLLSLFGYKNVVSCHLSAPHALRFQPFFPAGKSFLKTSANLLFPPSSHLYSEISTEMMTTFRLLCQDVPAHHTVQCCSVVFPYYPPVSICCGYIHPWGRNSLGYKAVFYSACSACVVDL